MLLRMPHSQGLLNQSVQSGLVAQCAAPMPLHAFTASIAQLVAGRAADQGRSMKPTCGYDPKKSCEHNHHSTCEGTQSLWPGNDGGLFLPFFQGVILRANLGILDMSSW